jgi:uncharacterized protein
MPLKKPNVVNDNLNGRIALTDLERDLLGTPSMIRLSRIQQLGLAQLVFPGATHTRLSHSLGVMHIAGRMCHQLGLNSDEEEKLRLAALLHDSGHYPLSHCIETVYRMLGDPEADPAKELFENPERADAKPEPLLRTVTSLRASTGLATDKAIAGHVVRFRPDISAVFSAHGRNDLVEDVTKIIAGEHPETLYTAIMNSDYDCDRLDYVRRDSHLAGVVYGHIDLEFLLENLQICNHPPTSTNRVLAVNGRKALVALEHYLMSRYYMYSQVVFHKTVRSLELMAKAAFIGLARRGFVYSNFREIVKAIPDDSFLAFDDSYFYAKCAQFRKEHSSEKEICWLISRVIERRPLRMVFEFRELVDVKGERTFREIRRVLTGAGLQALASKAGVDPNDIIVDIPKALELVPIAPEVPLDQVMAMAAKADGSDLQRALRVAPRIFDERTGEASFLVGQKGTIIHHLADKKLYIIRAYLATEDETTADRLERVLRDEFK